MSDIVSPSRTTKLPTESTESPLAAPAPPRPTTHYSWRNRNSDADLAYIRDPNVANTEIERLSPFSAVGFDQEWKPVFSKGAIENPVALIQLATPTRILLIQISAMSVFPEKLSELLENSDVVKAGVGIQNDVLKLYKDYRVSTRNCVDLSLLARSVDNARWKGKYSASIGLSRLVETYEYETLTKGKITRSNWEARLSPPQQDYAANDAHAGLIIYNRLSEMAESMSKPPKNACYSFDCVRGRLCEPSGAQWYAWNPDYDPGPPPPPKPPKPPKVKEFSSTAFSSAPYSHTAATPTLGSSVAPSDFLPPASGQTSIPAVSTVASRTWTSASSSASFASRRSFSNSYPRFTNPTGPGVPGPSSSTSQNNSGISMAYSNHKHLHHGRHIPQVGHFGLGPPATTHEEVEEGAVEMELCGHGVGSSSSQRGIGHSRPHGRGLGYGRGRGRGRGSGSVSAQMDYPVAVPNAGSGQSHLNSRPRPWGRNHRNLRRQQDSTLQQQP